MKNRVIITGLVSLGLASLCSCVGLGTKFKPPTDDQLVFGKLNPSNAIALFGPPLAKGTKTTKDGNFATYKYMFAEDLFGTVSSRVLLLEFKADRLNGYYFWSSFGKDGTKVNLDNVGKLRSGLGKLTQADVAAIMGKPAAKTLCPTTLTDFKDECDKNAEVWGWYMEEKYELNGPDPKRQAIYVTFDADGKVSGVETAEMDSLHRTPF